MVEITVKVSEDGFGIRCKGHASDSRVCAAVSMLEQAVTQAAYWEESCLVRYGPDVMEELSGEFWANVRYGDETDRRKMAGMASVAVAGFELLQYRYPDEVRLKKKRGGPIKKRGEKKNGF